MYLFVFEPILLFEGVHLVLSFVPNHSSKRHPWFIKSESNDTQYKDYYIWSSDPPKYDSEGKPEPPNNWVCMKLHAKCDSPNKFKE
jgi:glycosidase